MDSREIYKSGKACPRCAAKTAGSLSPDALRHVATTKAPSVPTMERWMSSGVARATDGCKTEPDGRCPHGHQSWIMRLGFI